LFCGGWLSSSHRGGSPRTPAGQAAWWFGNSTPTVRKTASAREEGGGTSRQLRPAGKWKPFAKVLHGDNWREWSAAGNNSSCKRRASIVNHSKYAWRVSLSGSIKVVFRLAMALPLRLINLAQYDLYRASQTWRQAEFIIMSEINHITGRQIAAARALTGLGQVELAVQSNISAPTLRRMEAAGIAPISPSNNLRAVVSALESAGVIFVPENGEGAGVRLKKDRQESA
jgi:DNA-binding transcriptional regulator YiaG